MILQNTPRRLLLLIIDCVILYISFIIAVTIRNGYVPEHEYYLSSLLPYFSLIFLTTVIIFYIYGLYDKPTLRLIRELSQRVTSSQILSGVSAVIIFYSLPSLGFAPKTILFIYVIVSSILITVWRYFAFKIVLRYRKQHSIIIGSGKSFHKLVNELNTNPHTGITLISVIDLDTYDNKKIKEVIESIKPDSVILDMRDDRVKMLFSTMYEKLFSGTAILDIINVYEDVFDMEPLDLLNQEWVFRHISKKQKFSFLKRIIDLSISLPAFILSFLFYPFVYIAIKIEDGGPIFFKPVRIGKHGKNVQMYKFRSMSIVSADDRNDSESRVTKVGSFIRKTRIDELPQLWNVIVGDLSLIGPRPESPTLVKEYEKNIPFYQVRHLTRPGLSGWAQIEQRGAPKFGVDVNQTETKLSYDLYYIKHHSILLDIAIILKTFKVLLSKSGI